MKFPLDQENIHYSPVQSGSVEKMLRKIYALLLKPIVSPVSDFWPGPLDTTNATIANDVCVQYDKHWKITLAEVKAFAEYYAENGNVDNYPVPDVIKTWPGTGDYNGKHQGRYPGSVF